MVIAPVAILVTWQSGAPTVRARRRPARATRRPEADARTRTGDPFITSEVLYQLSYVGGPGILAARRRGSGRRRRGPGWHQAPEPRCTHDEEPRADSPAGFRSGPESRAARDGRLTTVVGRPSRGLIPRNGGLTQSGKRPTQPDEERLEEERQVEVELLDLAPRLPDDGGGLLGPPVRRPGCVVA